MGWQTNLRQAEAWAQEELGAQLRLLEALRAHSDSLAANDAAAIEQTLEDLRGALCGESRRTARRAEWLRALGAAWGVDPQTLTLRSVAERAGPDGQRLAKLRDDLERTATDVVAAARRIALLARQQRAVVTEILSVLTGVDLTQERDSRGSLVHVEA